MNDAARARLNEFIKAYGPSVCNTPTMCKIMLNQYCGSYPAEVEVLNRALTSGMVERMLKSKPGEPWDAVSGPLVKELVGGGMAEAEAQWSVESWGRALGKHPDGIPVVEGPVVTAMSEPDQGPADPDRAVKAVSYTFLVAGSGAAGGALGAMAVTFAFGMIMSGAAGTIAPQASKAFDVMVLVMVLIQGFVGAVGGGIGAATGWLLGKGGGSRPWGAVTGSFSSAFLAGAIGGRFLGILGVFFGTLLASTGSALTGAYHSS